MRKLHRNPTQAGRRARAAVVVPDSMLSSGVSPLVKDDLLRTYNLHTIVRLSNGVFSPYIPIPTNMLFFDRSEPTKEVWYYEHPLPIGRKYYTKTQPLQFSEFDDCWVWWDRREENDRAWKVPASELLDSGCNLGRKNPRRAEDLTHVPPDQLLKSIAEDESEILSLIESIRSLL